MNHDDLTPPDVEYPSVRDRTDLPRGAGETFDPVVRHGPISLRGLMEQTATYSRDEVYGHLSALVDAEFLRRREGDLDRDGTTRDLYAVHETRRRDGDAEDDGTHEADGAGGAST